MKFVHALSGIGDDIESVLNPLNWPEFMPAVVQVEERENSGLLDVWVRWPIGIVRRMTVERTQADGVSSVDIVESEWARGGIYVDCHELTIELTLIHGLPGSFARELAVQFRCMVERLSEHTLSKETLNS